MSKRSKGIAHHSIEAIRSPLKFVRYFRKLDRNTKLAVSLVGILIVAGLFTALLRNDQPLPTTEAARQEEPTEIELAEPMDAKVAYTEGVVEYRNDVGEWTKAEKDTVLTKETGVRTTGASSRAIVELEDGSIIRIDANTEVIFGTISESRVIIEQKSGQVYSRVVEVEGKDYLVQTENARFQSNGTAFRTIASGDEEAVEVYQSSVKETNSNITVKEGEKLIAKSNVNPDLDGTSQKIDIEQLKKDSFITWNRDQDKALDAFKSSLGFLADFDGPKVDIAEPASGSSIDVADGQSTGSVSIKGKTEPKTTLTVLSKSISGSAPVTVAVNDDGSFDTGNISGAIGSSVFEFTAKDRVGNATILNVTYTFKKKTVVQEQGIALEVSETSDGKILLSWALVGITTPDGVKILYSNDDDLSFASDAKELIASGTTSKKYPLTTFTAGTTMYFQVCRYDTDNNECDIFSNIAQIDIE